MLKSIGVAIISIIIVLALAIIGFLGYIGYVPGISALFGANKPRDLGITYTETDRASGRQKSQVDYVTIKGSVPAQKSLQFEGSRQVNESFTQSEITAIMNNKPGIHYPYKNIQVKFNADGSGEISGTVVKSRLPTYAATFGTPQVVVDMVMKFLPHDPVFYLKGKATLVDNTVGIFEPQRFEIGRLPLPLDMILAYADPSVIRHAHAMDIGELSGELSQVSGKRALIIDFINSRIATYIPGFYAKEAHMEEGRVVFDGTLPEKELTVQ